MKEKKDIFIAVASRDGIFVNQHFGHATRFLIYRASADGTEFVEERKVSRYCLGEDTYVHPFEKDRFMNVLTTIKDCRYALVSRIGTVPEKRLKANGIMPVIAYDSIDKCICKCLKKKDRDTNKT